MAFEKLSAVLFIVGPLLHAQPMSVCEVLANLPALHGKQIKVRGIWRNGDAVRALWAPLPCEKPTIRDHWEFVDAILVGPLHGQQSVANSYRELRSTSKSHPGMDVWVTMLGVLNAPEHFAVSTLSGIEQPQAFWRLVAQLGFVDVMDFKAVGHPPGTGYGVQRRYEFLPRRVD